MITATAITIIMGRTVTIIRTLLREGRCDFEGTYYQVRDLELLPRGPRPEGPPLMIGSDGERMLGITLPHVTAWNAWFAWFDNRVERYQELHARIDAACRAQRREAERMAGAAGVVLPRHQARGDQAMADRQMLAQALLHRRIACVGAF